MKNKKRWLALGLVGIMTLGCFAGCGSKSDGKSADGKGDSSKGSVYYLNFKPEQDEAVAAAGKGLHKRDRCRCNGCYSSFRKL